MTDDTHRAPAPRSLALLAPAAILLLLLAPIGGAGCSRTPGAAPSPPADATPPEAESGAGGADAGRTLVEHPRREFVDPRDGAPMMLVPETSFVMGTDEAHPDLPEKPPGTGGKPLMPYDVLLARADPAWRHADERPPHPVTLSAYAMDRHEVTNARYRRFLEAVAAEGDEAWRHPEQRPGKDHTPRYWKDYNPLLRDRFYASTTPFGPETFRADDKPVVGVDWFDAWAYCRWAGKRLPTEAEWELACRGTDGRRWPWGNVWEWGLSNTGGEKDGIDVPTHGVLKDGWIYAAPPGTFPGGRSAFGCDDMAGNVMEWVADRYDASYYASSPERDPQGPERGGHRVIRGGNSQNYPSQVRCAARVRFEPDYRTFDLGFRCAVARGRGDGEDGQGTGGPE